MSKVLRRLRIRRGIRNTVSGTASRPRLSVFKSNRGITAQLIDDLSGHTLSAASSRELGISNNAKLEDSKNVGLKLAERAKEKGIESVVFDRGGYKYHGKVKSLAEGAREGGLKF